MLALFLAFLPAAGDVHVVAPSGGDFQDINSAVIAAADGDVILIKEGSYAGCVVSGKSLTVTAEHGANVAVDNAIVVESLDPEDTVVISGLRLGFAEAGDNPALWLYSNAGAVLVERCEIYGSGPWFFGWPSIGVKVEGCAAVVLSECTIGTQSLLMNDDVGLAAFKSDVALYDCKVEGPAGYAGPSGALPGGAACQLWGGTLFASGTTFQGGAGAPGTSGVACTDGADGGAGLELYDYRGEAPVARLLDVAAAGGAGGAAGGPGCADGASGAPIVVGAGTLETIPADARTCEIASPVREGVPLRIAMHGAPGEAAFLLVSFAQAPAYAPVLQGTLVPSGQIDVPLSGVIPVGGTLSWTPTVAFAPAVEGVLLHAQPLYYQPATSWVLGTPRPCVVLDAAL